MVCSVKVIKNPKNEKRVHSVAEHTTIAFFQLETDISKDVYYFAGLL